MVDASRVRTLTEKALDNFDNPGTSVAALVRQALRISVLRHDYAGQILFTLESLDFSTKDNANLSRLTDLKDKLGTLVGDESQRYYLDQHRIYLRNRAVDSGKYNPTSIQQIEDIVEHYEKAVAGFSIPSNLSEHQAFVAMQDMNAAQADAIPQISQLRNIISRVRQSVYDYLVQTEVEIDSGKSESLFFDQVQIRINSALNKHAPDAAQKFIGSQERVSSGGKEDVSHALTSCRRMMESLADSLYPANNAVIKGGDGVERTMSQDAYKNRILQFVAESVGKHKDGKVLKAAVVEIGSKLDALLSLANKGVHDDATLAEAHTCVIQTYLLAGSLLAIADGTSYLMQDEKNTASV